MVSWLTCTCLRFRCSAVLQKEADVTHAEVDSRMVVRPGGAKLRMQYRSSDGLSVSEDLHESSVDACQHGTDEGNACSRCRLQVGQLLP